MCLIKVKEEDDYSVPARVVRRERRRSPPSPRTSARVSHIEPRRQSIERTYVIQAPPPPPVIMEPPHYVPSVARPRSPPSPPRAPSPEPTHRTQSHYVEVSPGSVSSLSSSDNDVRSKTTSKSRRTAPGSEYHLREREYRRERGPSPPRDEGYDHYRYVRAPPERESYDRGTYGRDTSRDRGTSLGPRGSFVDDPRASRTSYRRERVIIEENDGRRTKEYRR